jgi:hypothetical protein
MADVMAPFDQWVPVSADLELFLGADELTAPHYRVRVEASSVGGPQVRCSRLLPAGFWLRPMRGGSLYVPTDDPYDTNQFRRELLELHRRRCWNCGVAVGGHPRYTPRDY